MSEPVKFKPLDKAGVYDGVPAEEYHKQLTVGPSISKSIAFDLFSNCPAKTWDKCYLNPNAESENKKEFDIGHAAHLILLEPDSWGERVVMVDAADYKTVAAREARDAAYAAGKTPLLPKQQEQIIAMHAALMRDKEVRTFIGNGGKTERTYVAKDPTSGLWLKARTDFEPDHMPATILDYKTTTDANPVEFEKRVWDNGYFIQDPWYRTVKAMATGEQVLDFVFLVQETKPPYVASLDTLHIDAFQEGMKVARWAINRFAECISNNYWPSYTHGGPTMVAIPQWARYRLADMDGIGALKPAKITQEMLRKLESWQSPLQLEKAS